MISTMKTKDLRTYSEKNLQELLKEKREALRLFRFNASSGKVKNVKEARGIRKEIARILTLLREKTVK